MSPPRTRLTTAVLTASVTAVALSSCGVVPDPDLVASVEGVELTEEQFDDYVREFTGDEDAMVIDGETGRQIVGTFVGVEVLRADLEAMGIEPVQADTDLDGVEKLQSDFQILVQEWSGLPAATTLDEAVIDHYEQGADVSGLVCPAHILVETEADAVDVIDQLGSGADFAETAFEFSIDSGSAQNGGSLGCYPTEQLELQFIAEFAEAARDAEIGVPTDPVESEFGWHVIQLMPVDQLSGQEVIGLRLSTFADRYDIVIDPRFGQWDPNAIVVPVT